jgi:hypothetical protein
VLPRPEKSEGKDNAPDSGEWRRLTGMQVPLLDHIVYQFRNRGEYCQGDRKGDCYGDGTFIHAWLPGMFSDAALKEIRGSEVLHITRFTPQNEAVVKQFTLPLLVNPDAYRHKK